ESIGIPRTRRVGLRQSRDAGWDVRKPLTESCGARTRTLNARARAWRVDDYSTPQKIDSRSPRVSISGGYQRREYSPAMGAVPPDPITWVSRSAMRPGGPSASPAWARAGPTNR